jgi:hypothetical protein
VRYVTLQNYIVIKLEHYNVAGGKGCGHESLESHWNQQNKQTNRILPSSFHLFLWSGKTDTERKYHDMKADGGVEVPLHASLTLALASFSGRFILREGISDIYWIESSVGPEASFLYKHVF